MTYSELQDQLDEQDMIADARARDYRQAAIQARYDAALIVAVSVQQTAIVAFYAALQRPGTPILVGIA